MSDQKLRKREEGEKASRESLGVIIVYTLFSRWRKNNGFYLLLFIFLQKINTKGCLKDRIRGILQGFWELASL